MILVETNVLFALSLTVMAGLATGIGSIIALFDKNHKYKISRRLARIFSRSNDIRFND